MSTKKAETSGRITTGDGPQRRVIADMLAIAVGVEPSDSPVKPPGSTAA